MKLSLHYIFIVLLLFLGIPGFGQTESEFQIQFRNRIFTPSPNISDSSLKSFNKRAMNPQAKFLIVIQFQEIPTDAERNQLVKSGIELLDYLPRKAYLASVKNEAALSALKQSNARAIVGLIPEDKIHLNLFKQAAEVTEGSKAGKVKVWLNFPTTFTVDEVRTELYTIGLTILSEELVQYQIVELEIELSQLPSLAALNCVKFIQEPPGKMVELNDKSPAYSKSNVLKSSLLGGFNLSGKGVVVGVGDNGDPHEHIDISRQTYNHLGITGEYHGVFVMGILGGKAIMNEKYEGVAPKATMVAQNYSKIIYNSNTYVKDYGMVIANNSYGSETYVCSDFGEYNMLSKIVDQQAFESPSLQHVFAAGNSGEVNLCNVLPLGYGTILSGYQSSKNGISVGSISNLDVLRPGSSRGPVKDGRVKPELVAYGTGVNSTIPGNKYSTLSGTSMSAPAVSGGLALLYERYRILHGGANPSNALMKAVLVNGATDVGEKGLDYKNGYGKMNLLRSVEMLNHQNHYEQSLAHQTTKSHSVVITPQTAFLKAMLYWNDPASSMMTPVALVNNLDLTVVSPSGDIIRPQVLNKSSVTELSATGTDDLNNMEQVLIENPVAGTYAINVYGKSIPTGPQNYVVVFDTVQVGTKLTYPLGNEKMVANEVIQISWESYGTASTFKVEYSLNAGNSWTVLNTAVPATSRQLQWTIPNTATVSAKVRVTQNTGGLVQTSANFTILGIPTITLNPVQCEGYIAVSWTAVSGATDYEVMILDGEEMKPVAITSATNYNFSGLLSDSTYYVSVRARLNTIAGRRGIAVSRKPADGNCIGAISDHDLRLVSIVSPSLTGRKNTSSAFSDQNELVIRIKNLDDVVSSETFRVGYAFNGNPNAIIWETISPTIAPNATFDHTFGTKLNMQAVGNYPVTVLIDKQNDPVSANNQLSVVFRQLDNVKVALPYVDNFENLSNQDIRGSYSGVDNGRYDLTSSTEMGRLRTFPGSDLTASGSKALVLDVYRYHLPGNVNYLVGTYNFEDYSTLYDELLLTFKFKNFGQHQDSNNKVWIRGNDTNPWIEVYDLYANQIYPSLGYANTTPIEISKILRQANQQFSSSFQVRWGQEGTRVAADADSGGGYSFDDISFFTATDDIRVVDFIHPVKLSCGLGSQEHVQVTVRNNSSNAISNIPIHLQSDGGSVISESIASIPAGTTITYTFGSEINISELNSHHLKVWTSLPSDTYADNNLIEMSFFNSLSVSAFPYFQNFESNADGWISKGTNVSWQYGIPVAEEINKAGSGEKIWKTNLSGNYNALEESYLYSPCFDIGGMEHPTLSFNMKYAIETCNSEACDYLYMEYSGDGNTWKRLGTHNTGSNWYNEENNIWRGNDNQRWKVRTVSFPKDIQTVRFRFVFKSDEASQLAGVSIDDIHVYDLYNEISPNTVPEVATDQKSVQGQDWIHFVGTEGILASMKANNEILGNTLVSSYQHAGIVRNDNGAYYLNRNFTIHPQVQPVTNPVQVRLYFLDTDVEAILSGNDCVSCIKPQSAYEIFVTKYHTSNKMVEDGNLHNNSLGTWTFFDKDNVTVVPYGKGYYLEFETNQFSEFWLGKGELFYSNPLAVTLSQFKAEKTKSLEGATEVLLRWRTESELDFSHFEVEVADNLDALRANQFTNLVTVNGHNEGTAKNDYSYIDRGFQISSHRYYRLKMIDVDQTVNYSSIQVVSFENPVSWQLYPNPSSGVFYLKNTHASTAQTQVRVFDQGGKLHRVLPLISGMEGEYKIDLSNTELMPGIYIMEVNIGDKKQVFKAIKN
jgi:hypothetical protein